MFAALPTSAYLYDAAKNSLTLVAATDVRQVLFAQTIGYPIR